MKPLLSKQTWRDFASWEMFAWPLVAYLLLHAGLAAHNFLVPGAIMRGDRAGQRLNFIESFVAAPSKLPQIMLASGWPGDWLAHGLLWLMGGSMLVVFVQIMLGALAITATIGIARALGAGTAAAATAGMLAVALPGGIMNPHLLVNESWFAAMVALGLWSLAEAVRRDRGALVIGGMLLMGAAALIRPQGMILAPVALGILYFISPSLRRNAFVGALLAIAIAPGLWLGWRYLQTGEFGLGPSGFDLASNLRLRINRAADIAGLRDRAIDTQSGGPRVTIREFLVFAWQYPIAVIQSFLSDLFNFIFNPGANHLFGHYLKMIQTPDDYGYWKRILDTKGLLGLFSAILAQGMGLLFTLLLMGLVHVTALFGAAMGLWYVIKYSTRPAQSVAFLILALTATQVAATFVAGIVRWAHRAPMEPVVAALAGIGLYWAYCMLRNRRT